jgi:L-alanine-DL-glutamate epimerase-like enolase superfamily enzyme
MPGFCLKSLALHFLPVHTRMPLKFGAQVVTRATCARVMAVIENRAGHCATGWGETPLSVAWVWPSTTHSWEERETALRAFCHDLVHRAAASPPWNHPIDWGSSLASTLDQTDPSLPLLAKLCCLSAIDLAVWDAFGVLLGKPVFELLDHPLDPHLGPAFEGARVSDFVQPRLTRLPAWHLVGGLDPLEPADLDGSEPEDGHPVLLRDWIRRDGLKCLKVKLLGTDLDRDFSRYVRVGLIALDEGVTALSADFNCTVRDPAYVCEFLDRLRLGHPRLHDLTLYIEQPFPYDLERHWIDVRSISARKPLFLDESAHDWRHVQLGRELGWTGVALKTCKTLTGALLSLCWARRHGMSLMVQDLTNPMLAQLSHLTLAAYAGTLRGVESNSMQFYPDASLPEAAVHPGCFRREHGHLDLSTLGPAGFGYRIGEIARVLPEPALVVG